MNLQKNLILKLLPNPVIKYFIVKDKLQITIFEIDDVKRLIDETYENDYKIVKQVRLWCFDLACIDKTSFKNTTSRSKA